MNTNENILLLSALVILFIVVFATFLHMLKLIRRVEKSEVRNNQQQSLQESVLKFIQEQAENHHKHRRDFDTHQVKSLKLIQDSIQKGSQDSRLQLTDALKENTLLLTKQVEKLTKETDSRLKEISGQVEKRLSEGFDKTTQIFTDVVKRLALIDQAQKKITELSSNVIGLQEILSDKKSRGALGEVQLENLIRNMMPEANFAFQYTMGNGNRADCVLYLPEPTGTIAIDSKFPLESYRVLTSSEASKESKHQAHLQFKRDIKKHIQDIASKYIIPGETSDGAVMFIPAESIFAEIHSHYADIVEVAHKSRVWLVSPTTMMAILTTARAVIKDEATRKQVHIIQEHLGMLSKDFKRFESRMDALARHINQANEDVVKIHQSSRKITSRFQKIETVELQHDELAGIEVKKTT